jgi:hypothetical protein
MPSCPGRPSSRRERIPISDSTAIARQPRHLSPLRVGSSRVFDSPHAHLLAPRRQLPCALAERIHADRDGQLGIEARSRALLSEGEAAEGLYLEAITRLGRTRARPSLARAHLVYGEWLRRERRRLDAREHLRIAHSMDAEIGMNGFAERARRELVATGETVRKRSPDTRDSLTAQEAQIARLAAEGSSNPEIGAQLSSAPHGRVAPTRGVREAGDQLAERAPRAVPSANDVAADGSRRRNGVGRLASGSTRASCSRHDTAAQLGGTEWLGVSHSVAPANERICARSDTLIASEASEAPCAARRRTAPAAPRRRSARLGRPRCSG